MTKAEREFINAKIAAAEAAGAAAFARGASAIPAHDPELRPILRGLPIGRGAIRVLDAWHRGWHTANVRKPLP